MVWQILFTLSLLFFVIVFAFDFSLMDGLGYWYWYRGYNTTYVFGGQLSGGNSNDGDDGSDAG